MGSRPRSRRTVSSPLARALLLVLLLLPLPAAAAGEATEGKSDGDGGGDALFSSLADAGWTATGEVRRFTAENLYEEIDGEAELFLPYGFRSLRVAILASPTHPGTELRLELFHLAGTKDAYGIYSQHRFEGQETAPVKEGEAAVSDASADFFRGAWFVRLRLASGSLPRAALLDAARAADRALSGTSSLPEGAAYLAARGAVPGTILFQRRALSGYEALAPGFEGRLPGAEGKILLLEGPPEEIAKRLASLPGYRRADGGASGGTDGKGSPGREEWRADLPSGTLYLRRCPGGVAGVVTKGARERALEILDRLAPAPPQPGGEAKEERGG